MSLSSQTDSSSSDSQWKYDVFLSFRGPDTRKGITTDLYNRLQKRGVKTFMDEEGLQVGDGISPTLLAAIRKSRFAIVVLSQNYASSAWCLEELSEICLSMEDNSRILPVFYEVDPTNVRYQKESFGRDFSKHESSGRHKPEKVKEWRDALYKVANISGWNTNDHKTHAELVDLILESVCRKVKPAAIEPMGELEEFQATRKAMDEVMKALKDDEINVVGVYGMGGVGKTTMVNHVGAQACKSGSFRHVVMVVVSQNPDFEKLQYALAQQLGLKLDERTGIGRIAILKKEIMRQEKLLIILDDVWGKTELSKIGIPSYNSLQTCKSKVLLTTRRFNVCHTMESQAKVHLTVLSEDDAWNLFLKKARKSFEKSTEFYEVARMVARECAGLPIALVVVAGALGDKDLEDWKEAARRLKMSQPANLDEEKDVFNCIKLSYDFLASDDAKSCFLLCCLFPEDYDIPIEDLMKYGFGTGLFRDVNNTIENARARAKSVVKYLKASSLLLESAKEGCVKMHDVIRDMAIRIAQSVDGHTSLVNSGCDLKDWSMDAHEDYSAISLIQSNICKLPDKLVCPQLKILLLQGNADIRKIPNKFFQSPNDLRVLDLRRISISLLPQSFRLLTGLQVLRLDGCLQALYLDGCEYRTDYSIIGKLKSLEILSMRKCSSLTKFPKEMGNLSNLRILDISGTRCRTFPSQVISRLSRLEELYMRISFFRWGSEIEGGLLPWCRKNASFDEITSLSRLTTLQVGVDSNEDLPLNVKFNPYWINFSISIGWVEYKPGSSSREVITDTSMKQLPDWFISVVTEKTEELKYTFCYGFTNLLEEHDRGRLHGLKYLQINNLGEEVLLNTNTYPRVSNEPVFENLKELHVIKGHDLEELCVGELPPGSLQNLKILKVNDCRKFVNPLLPSRLLKRLQSLEKLQCSDMKRMKYVFGFEGDETQYIVLTKLRVILLIRLDSLRSIWNGPAPPRIFQSLKILYLDDCPEIEYLFTSDIAQCMLQLEDLWVQHCRRLDRIIEASEEIESNKIILQQLKNLVLRSLPELTRLSSTSSSTIDIEIGFPSLEHLYVHDCPRFSSAADMNRGFPTVQYRERIHHEWILSSNQDARSMAKRISLIFSSDADGLFPPSALTKLLDRLNQWVGFASQITLAIARWFRGRFSRVACEASGV